MADATQSLYGVKTVTTSAQLLVAARSSRDYALIQNLDADAALEAFYAHLDQLEAESGVELDASERQRVFGLSVAGGFSPESTLDAFNELVPDDDEDYDDGEEELGPGAQRLVDDFQHDLGQLERKLKRPVSEHERDHLIHAVADQARRHDSIDVDGALEDYQAQFATDQSRAEFFDRRLKEQQAEPAIREDGYDLDDQQQRAEYLGLRMAGHEAEDTEEPEWD